MPDNVATLVSNRPLTTESVNEAAAVIKHLGVDQVACSFLSLARAADILFSGSHPDLLPRVRAALAAFDGIDIFVQKNDQFRRKKLFLADMDATIVVGETLDDLGERLGLKDKIAPITAAAMRGELDFSDALRQRIRLLKGVPETVLYDAVEDMRIASGAGEAVKTMAAHGVRCVLISGGFEMFTGHVAAVLGFHRHVANRLHIEDMKLTGDVIPPIIDKHVKKTTLEDEARALGLDMLHTMAVGDGANDIPMLQMAGTGVGYFGKPAVQAATPYQIRHTDLTALLYMQGYKESDVLR